MTYDEAIQTAKQRLRIWDGYGGNDTPESVIDQANGVADALRALLAGPPEPSEEEVARVDVQKAMHPVREYLLAMGTRQRFAEEAAERATDAAFALLSRSRRA